MKEESKFSYTNKFSGKTCEFTPKEDELVVTYEVDKAAFSSGPTGAAFSSRPILDVLDLSDDAAAMPTGVGNSIPVMIDDEGLTRYFMPDEYTVQFREDISEEDAEQILQELGSHIIVKQRTRGYYTVSVPEDKGLFETLQIVSDLDEVEFAAPSEFGLNDFAYIPDTPEFQKLWGLVNTGQTVNGKQGTAGADIKIAAAWELTKGAPNVTIVIIDSGVDLDHPDLRGNLLPRDSEDWDFFPEGDDVPEDEDNDRFHGTHVAGIAAAVNNGEGVIGVAPECRFMPLRIKLSKGFNANRADAINYVTNRAIENPDHRYVVNCSWIMNGDEPAVARAITKATANNVLIVFAAGNAKPPNPDGRDITASPQYPAVYPEVIAVAAIDQNEHKARVSNYGKQIDVSAPGENILSTTGNGGYALHDGTSMAAPYVAGLAALIWSLNSNLSNNRVRHIIESTCDNIDAANPDFAGKLGKGRINAIRALTTAREAKEVNLQNAAVNLLR